MISPGRGNPVPGQGFGCPAGVPKYGPVRGFLLAAHHSHRYALTTDERLAAPRTFRKAVEMIEERICR